DFGETPYERLFIRSLLLRKEVSKLEKPVLPSKPPNGLPRPWQKFLSSSVAWKNVRRHLHLHTLLQTPCRLNALRHFPDCTHFQGFFFSKSRRNN
uniref:Uncharacterized protein n=1 Tax=Buteo japonicus TaxID=224669 RepID=A0A8C0HMU2_9AVES